MDDIVIFVGDSYIKTIGDEGEIGAHSIVFGNNDQKDFHGNWFTKNTNTGFFPGGVRYDIGLLNHRVPLFKKGQFDSVTEKALKKISDMTFKNPVLTTVDEVGQFSKLVLDLSDKYEKMVYDLTKQGVLKWSAGAAPQTYKALPSGELTLFVTAERSLTPIPAEYQMLQHRVMPLKAYTDFLKYESKGIRVDEKQLSSAQNFMIAMKSNNFLDSMN